MQPENLAKEEASDLIISISTKTMVELFPALGNKNLRVPCRFFSRRLRPLIPPAGSPQKRPAKYLHLRQRKNYTAWRREPVDSHCGSCPIICPNPGNNLWS